MKLFPDTDSRNLFMKKGLPVVLAVVWAPVVWLALSGFIAPLLRPVTSSDLLSQVVVIPLTLIATRLLLRLFVRLSRSFSGTTS
ncbi:hypothetical protein EKD02_08100 [Chlorobium phaeovibrioides]|uniref:Uncharacterized protein n=3 Tax=Chlorobium phaeovibrioides TaxID=1094 RepID=A0A3S0N9L9_CHLPH|nr:hypothetical protein [Chlorobium phaeovibrioides]KAA6232757.1 hypothetical protein FP507_06510 [Chlorobium phaeovibrioides]RTY36338.1 hypothetical protein EKD02_08100 [Chlorobium phaeovibrioides]HCD37079.1 hypothetical protein [Chlorobium sp.]